MAYEPPITYYNGGALYPLDATVTINPIGPDKDVTLVQGNDLTLTGTLATNGDTIPSVVGTYLSLTGFLYMPIQLRPVNADGTPGAAQALGQATLVDTGTKQYGQELFDWSLTAPTASLPSGLYDIEAFGQTTIEAEFPNVPFASLPDNANHPAFEYLSIVPADTSPGLALDLPASSGEISTDGRYLVYAQNGQSYERDLQTGAQVALAAGAAPPEGTFQPGQTIQTRDLSFGETPGTTSGSLAESYSYAFTSADGAYTFGAIGSDHPYIQQAEQPYQEDGYYDGYNAPLFPVVTNNDTGVTTLLKGFDEAGIGPIGEPDGVPVGASDNGDVVLTQNFYGNGLGDEPGPGIAVSYLNPAPVLTLDPVNGTDQIAPGTGSAVISGFSDAVGQQVEIDFGQAGAAVGTATVMPDGSWQFGFDPATISGSSLFVEASVTGTDGTPAQASETVQFDTLPTPRLVSITADTDTLDDTFGPGQTLTIRLNASEPITVTGGPTLSLSNGATAIYSAGSGTTQIDFTYIPGLDDAGSGDLSVTGLTLAAGAAIGDAAGDTLIGSFTGPLGISLQTTPNVLQLYPSATGSPFVTDTATPVILVAGEAGETVTLFDNGVNVGSAVTPDYDDDDNEPKGITEVSITPTRALPEGTSALTAVATVDGQSSAFTAPLTVTVDTATPAETITQLAVNGNDDVSLADQAARNIVVTGTLSTALLPDEGVVVSLPGGYSKTVTPGSGATTFSLTLSPAEAAASSGGGSVSAVVQNIADTTGQAATQLFTAEVERRLTLVSPNPQTGSEAAPSLSGDGTTVAFAELGGSEEGGVVGADAGTAPPTPGVYVADVATSTATLVAVGAEDASLSGSGGVVAYDSSASGFGNQVYVDDLSTGVATLVSHDATDPSAAGDNDSVGPSLSADGDTVAFVSDADDLLANLPAGSHDGQIYVATLSDGTPASVALMSGPASGAAQGNSSAPSVSADGNEVAFASPDSNLLGPGDPHAPNLDGVTQQVYVRALADDPASGLAAGQLVLASGLADGTVGNANSVSAVLSANGRYVAFISDATNLMPDNLAPGATLPAGVEQVYEKDLLTGSISLVSQTPGGAVGDGDATSVSISSDGQTVAFADGSGTLGSGLAAGSADKVYVSTLLDGAVTGLTLVSQAGALPGNGFSDEASLSADGGTVAFNSDAGNLDDGMGGGTGHVYVYVTDTAGVACYCRGTRILTARGERPVETLA